MQKDVQLPKSKYFKFWHVKQFVLLFDSFWLHVLQSEWHLSIVFNNELFKKYPSGISSMQLVWL